MSCPPGTRENLGFMFKIIEIIKQVVYKLNTLWFRTRTGLISTPTGKATSKYTAHLIKNIQRMNCPEKHRRELYQHLFFAYSIGFINAKKQFYFKKIFTV